MAEIPPFYFVTLPPPPLRLGTSQWEAKQQGPRLASQQPLAWLPAVHADAEATWGPSACHEQCLHWDSHWQSLHQVPTAGRIEGDWRLRLPSSSWWPRLMTHDVVPRTPGPGVRECEAAQGFSRHSVPGPVATCTQCPVRSQPALHATSQHHGGPPSHSHNDSAEQSLLTFPDPGSVPQAPCLRSRRAAGFEARRLGKNYAVSCHKIRYNRRCLKAQIEAWQRLQTSSCLYAVHGMRSPHQ